MDKVIVLVTEGKHESVDYVTVFMFDTEDEASKFCKEKSTGKQKYWIDACIVLLGDKIYLMQSE